MESNIKYVTDITYMFVFMSLFLKVRINKKKGLIRADNLRRPELRDSVSYALIK